MLYKKLKNLDLNNDEKVIIADLTFQEIRTKVISKDHISCKSYSADHKASYMGFINCGKSAVW